MLEAARENFDEACHHFVTRPGRMTGADAEEARARLDAAQRLLERVRAGETSFAVDSAVESTLAGLVQGASEACCEVIHAWPVNVPGGRSAAEMLIAWCDAFEASGALPRVSRQCEERRTRSFERLAGREA